MEKELSRDFNVKDAAIRLTEMESPEDILTFISGDDRKTVLFPTRKDGLAAGAA